MRYPHCAAALTLLITLIAHPPHAPAAGSCSGERPREVMEALTAVDDAGERELKEKLTALAKQESWTQSQWEAYTLSLADNPRANELEARRDQLTARLFGVLARPPLDCAELDRLEAEIIDVERAQWRESIEQVERRLGAPAADYL